MTYSSSWRSPSNIALVKYWGKHGLQLPRNPSLSFTLSACHTDMKVMVSPEADSAGLQVFYEGQPMPSFEAKIKTFFSHLADRFPWLAFAAVEIDSVNTFPHAAGIASSASAMSALALCLKDIDDQIKGIADEPNHAWWSEVSDIARLGSGSASRSVFPHAAMWGHTPAVPESSDLFAIPCGQHIAPFYKSFRDSILIVSSKEKSVSSTQGHAFMDELPYAATRYAEAHRNIALLGECMKTEDQVAQFISIVESEALQLHALMMAGAQPFILMEPGTIAIIKVLWQFREKTGLPVCITLDAGPNVHMLYPEKHEGEIRQWIDDSLVQYCASGQVIHDQVGAGPVKNP